MKITANIAYDRIDGNVDTGFGAFLIVPQEHFVILIPVYFFSISKAKRLNFCGYNFEDLAKSVKT